MSQAPQQPPLGFLPTQPEQASYQPKDDEKDYVHILVSAKQGQPVTPKVELYHPVSVPGVMSLTGFKGDIVYDPRTAAQKQQVAPPADTVKADEPLSSADSYRARYKVLFHEDAPFNIGADEVKRIVDRAEVNLVNLAKGIEPTDETDAENDLPTNKTEWFALFQKTFPEDTTAYEAITVPVMREKLGK